MNKKTTLRALLMSLIALLACVSMLIGSTFAWFTDSVSSMNNIIKSGNLDIELEYTLDGATWTAVADDTSIFGEDDLWEPGHTVVAGLRIKNVGSLALKYALSTHIYLEKTGINVYGEEFKLSDYLDVYYGAAADEAAVAGVFADRATALNGLTAGDFNVDLSADSNLLAGASEYALLAITMPTTVDNVANYKTGTAAPYIRFGIDLYATQYTYEEDSFNDQYDKDAAVTAPQKYPYAIVTDNGPKTVVSEDLFGSAPTGDQIKYSVDLDATYTFEAPQDDTDYDEWIADYEVSVITPDGNKLPEGAVIMSGQYNFISTTAWQSFYTPEVESGVAYRLLGTFNFDLTYDQIKSLVGTFQCGVKNVNAPAGTVMKVALKLYNENAAGDVIAEKTVGVFTYTF